MSDDLSPSSDLSDMIVGMDWEGATRRMSERPIDSAYCDESGMKPLHIACCYSSTPIEVIEGLLAAYPSAASDKDFCGNTPLHYASTNESSDASVVRVLLLAFPGGASVKNWQGCTPLHCSCWSTFASHEVVKALLEADVSTITIRGTRKMRTPLQMLLDEHDTVLESIEAKVSRMRKMEPKMSADDIISRLNKTEQSMWIKTTLLFKASHHKSVADPLACERKWRVLHACVGTITAIESTLPSPSLVRIALNLCPEQLREADEDGNLPLHVAAAAASVSNEPWPNRVMDYLLREYPEGAKVCNRHGRRPYEVAVDRPRERHVHFRESTHPVVLSGH